MIKEDRWPQRGELIIGTVVRVNPYSAFISLEEYQGKEGMIHISEVAGKWVRDIREFVKTGKKIVALVMVVDREKNHITLSLKRVKRYDAEEKMKEYKRDIKAKKMLVVVSKKLNLSQNESQDMETKLKEIFGELFKAFQMSMTSEGYDLLRRKGIPEEWTKIIKIVAEEQMEVKETEIKGIIELKCSKPNGIDLIKKVLEEAKEKHEIEIKYISAPKYSLLIRTKEAKFGERKLKEASEEIIKNIKALGGEGSFKVE